MSARMKRLLFYGSVVLALVGYQVYRYGLPSSDSLLGVFHGERSTFWIGVRPLKCYGHQVVHVKSTTVHSQQQGFTDPLEGTITAMGRCHVIIEDAHLSADDPLVALDHSLVTVKNSEIDCSGHGDCISANGHARVELDHVTIRAGLDARACTTCETSKTSSPGSGVSLMQHAAVVMNGGLIDAHGGSAIEAHDDASIELHDATLRSHLVVDHWGHELGTALELRDGPRVEAFGGLFDASPPALWSEGPATIELHGTKVVGGWHSFHAKQLSGLPKNASPGDGAR